MGAIPVADTVRGYNISKKLRYGYVDINSYSIYKERN